MRPASGKASADIGFRDVVTAHFDTLGDSADGKFGRWQPEVVEFDLVAEGFGLLEQLGVSCAAECAFEAEGYAVFQAALDFVEQEFTGFDGEFLRIERRKPARDFVGVEEARDGIELAEVVLPAPLEPAKR
jgi:hypothetical protein